MMRDEAVIAVLTLIAIFVVGFVAGTCRDISLGDQWSVETIGGGEFHGAIRTDGHDLLWVLLDDGTARPVLWCDVLTIRRIDHDN